MSPKRRGRHEGTVRKRSDGRYEARLEVGISSTGRRIQQSFYGRTKQEALEKLNTARGLAGAKKTAKVTLAEYLASWLGEVKQTRAYSTYQQRETIVRKHINPYLGGLRLANMKAEQVRAMLNSLRAHGVGERTTEMAYVVLHVALSTAVRLGLIASNPCGGCAKPKTRKKPVRIWTQEQANRFLTTAVQSDYYALFVLAVTTGMRQGELLALQWQHVDLEHAFLSVLFSLADGPNGPMLKEPKTSSSVRRVDLSRIAVDALRALGQKEHGLVFVSPDGKPIRKSNFIRRVFHPLIEKAGVPKIRFHGLRHTSNTLLLLEGVSPNVVAERMGHATTRMTLDTYGHVLAGAQRDAADKMDSFFAAVSEFGGHSVVKEATIATDLPGHKKRKFNVIKALSLVEMGGLEPPTPYMRSKCSTS
jgi:integrase